MTNPEVLIIGGGVSGLATAWWLADAGVSVEIWEQEDRPGGKIGSRREAGYLLEQSASMVMNFRPEVSQFMEATGLVDSKSPGPTKPTRYLVRQGRLMAVPGSLGAMLSSPLFSLQGRLRLALEPFIPPGRSESESVTEFISRRLGHEMLEQAIAPYVAGPLASDPDVADAASVLPRLTDLERRYGSLTMGMFVHKVLRRRTAAVTEAFSFQGGMSTLVNSLVEHPRISFRPGRTATGIVPSASGWTVAGASASADYSLEAPQIVISTPAGAAASLLAPLDAELGQRLSQIEYAPVSVVHMGFTENAIAHTLDANGFLVPPQAGLALTGSLWMSSIFPHRAPSGRVLLTNYLGGSRRRDAVNWSDERSTREVLTSMRQLLGARGDPEMVHIDRHHSALPLYHGDYLVSLQAIEERLQRLPGLHLEANYRGGVSIRDRIVCANKAAQAILAALGDRRNAEEGSLDTGMKVPG